MLQAAVELRPAPVAPTPGGTGAAVRAAMKRVRAAAVSAADTAPDESGQTLLALDEALDDLDREVTRLVRSAAQELARARHDEPQAAGGVAALRRPRRQSAPGV
jgi:hypothetical protein